jgi:hypothetical protein
MKPGLFMLVQRAQWDLQTTDNAQNCSCVPFLAITHHKIVPSSPQSSEGKQDDQMLLMASPACM